jgi:hypothetical protein
MEMQERLGCLAGAGHGDDDNRRCLEVRRLPPPVHARCRQRVKKRIRTALSVGADDAARRVLPGASTVFVRVIQGVW